MPGRLELLCFVTPIYHKQSKRFCFRNIFVLNLGVGRQEICSGMLWICRRMSSKYSLFSGFLCGMFSILILTFV